MNRFLSTPLLASSARRHGARKKKVVGAMAFSSVFVVTNSLRLRKASIE